MLTVEDTQVDITYHGMSVTQSITVEPSVKWNGKGTKDDPYLLESPEHLADLSIMVDNGNDCRGVYYKFTEDLTLPENWNPIGSYNADGKPNWGNPFSGEIDGNNKLLTIPAGSLSLLERPVDAVVKNLNIYGEKIPGYGLVENCYSITVENVRIKTGSHILKSGLLGGYGVWSKTLIENCVVEEGVVIGDDGTWGDLGDTSYEYTFCGTFNHQDCIGSFAGAFAGRVRNCVSYATVYGRNNVGGIVGFKNQSMRDFYVTDCACVR